METVRAKTLVESEGKSLAFAQGGQQRHGERAEEEGGAEPASTDLVSFADSSFCSCAMRTGAGLRCSRRREDSEGEGGVRGSRAVHSKCKLLTPLTNLEDCKSSCRRHSVFRWRR